MPTKYKLMMGDCLELMSEIPGKIVSAVLCDPPYGIDYQSTRVEKAKRKPKIRNDKTPFVYFIPHLNRILKDDGCVFVFTRWDVQQSFLDAMKDNGLKVRNVLIWDKVIHGMGDLKRAYGSRYESIIFASGKDFRFVEKRPQDIIRCQRVQPMKLVHPNEKPVQLLETLIRQTVQQNGVVLDCFMGSGATGIACMNTNRRFIGMEMDPKYFEIAKQRIEQAAAEPAF